MRKLILVMGLFVILLVNGCNGIDISNLSDEDLSRLSEKAVVCNDPYIRIGTGCCLDQNSNNICDEDEKGQGRNYGGGGGSFGEGGGGSIEEEVGGSVREEEVEEREVGGNVNEEQAEVKECMATTDDGYLSLNFECKTATDCDRHIDEISPVMEKLGITEGGLTYKEFVKSTDCIPSSYKKIPVDNGFITCESKTDCVNILYGDAAEGTYIYKKAVICENNFCKILENSLKDTLSAARVGIFSSGTPNSLPEGEEVIVIGGSGTIQEEDTE